MLHSLFIRLAAHYNVGMSEERLLTIQSLPNGEYAIHFRNLRNVRRVYSDLIRSLNILDENTERHIVLDFGSLTGSIYSPAAISISGIVDYYRDYKGWQFSFSDRRPDTYLFNAGLNHPYTISEYKANPDTKVFNRVVRFDSRDDVAYLSESVIRDLKRTLVFGEGVLQALSWCMNEVLDNVFTHSGTDHGYFMIQIHNRKKIINVSIFDTGCGLLQSLGKSTDFSPKDEMEAIELAVQKGVTESRSIGQGNGLYGLWKIAKENGGHMAISTGHCMVEYDFEKNSVIKKAKMPILAWDHRGTRVDFTFHYERKTDVMKALDGYETKETFELDLENLEAEDGTIFYPILDMAKGDVASRVSGRSLRMDILNTARTTTKPVILDFRGIEMITSSFADELVGKMIPFMGFIGFNSKFRIIHANKYVLGIIERAISMRQKELFS